MDYIAELDKVLKMLQELEVVAKYGNIKKLTAAMEGLLAIANALREENTPASKEAALDE